MSWNDDRIDLLKKLWAEGFSASQIALRINVPEITRNSVISKVHRLRHQGHDIQARDTKRPIRQTRKRLPGSSNFNRAKAQTPVPDARVGQVEVVHQEPVAPYVPAAEIEVPLSQRKTFDQLESHHCRWPIGDPREEGFAFCGGRKAAGLPYCPDHARVAYMPPDAPRRAPSVAGRALPTIAMKTPEEVA